MIKVSKLDVPPNARLAADAAVLRASYHRRDDTRRVIPTNYRPIVELVSCMPTPLLPSVRDQLLYIDYASRLNSALWFQMGRWLTLGRAEATELVSRMWGWPS
jgi:hypothetical protein